jgi:hypothetical protein
MEGGLCTISAFCSNCKRIAHRFLCEASAAQRRTIHPERWHYLSFLRTNNVREILKSARVRALEPHKIETLIAVIEGDLGYQLHQAVQRVKFGLSERESAEFAFRDRTVGASTVELCIPITRSEFESWISEDLAAIEHSVDPLLKSRGRAARGGSGFPHRWHFLCTSRAPDLHSALR